MLLTIVAFVVALGVLIAVHEYGHYRVAVACGVKVLRFSVGFGKPLLKWQPKGSPTEFVLAAFPLGGYVKMLDEREAPVAPEERHLAFNTQPLRSRAAIVAAGPIANLLLAVVLYSVVNWTGVEEGKPLLGNPVVGSIADQAALDLKQHRIVNVRHSHEAAVMAVTLVRNGDAEAIMKGSLHTDELLAEVVSRASGLRTSRRVSHVFLMDVPGYPHPVMITDAVVNISPTLEDKAHIIQNAIDLAHIIGIPQPKVAILSAIETINPKIQSTLDAAALCKMADRGQITGGLLDGPLAFDNAVSLMAAKTKGITSNVAGRADILVTPDLVSGNMLAKQLEYMANALAAAIVIGAKVPIVLTSRADTAETRMASCVIASLVAHHNRGKVQES